MHITASLPRIKIQAKLLGYDSENTCWWIKRAPQLQKEPKFVMNTEVPSVGKSCTDLLELLSYCKINCSKFSIQKQDFDLDSWFF